MPDEHTRALYRLQSEQPAGSCVIGIDEVGRGAVAGPLTVAAIALPLAPMVEGLDDSKKLSPRRRDELAVCIKDAAIAWGVAHVAPARIDRMGMARALRLAMLEALEATDCAPDLLLIDGNPVHIHPQEHCVVKGDATVACIAAASIIAKVTRDAIMVKLDAHYPEYGFVRNKGYATAEHQDAIRSYGLTKLHRKSFCTGILQERLFDVVS
ncbi:MAG: ribonuclease HII [Coriobacteriales bacterium]|jgi:ribonuclease HII|nr:ribonuclease HII [Coriobacteriales bacterium]